MEPQQQESPFVVLGRAQSEVEDLVRRIAGIADKLAGPVPADDVKQAGIGAGGLLPATGETAWIIIHAVRGANEELNRIERLLP